MRLRPVVIGSIVVVGIYFLLVSAIHLIANQRGMGLWDDEWLSREVNSDGVPFEEACQDSFLQSFWWVDIRFIYFSMTWATINMPFSGGWIPVAVLGGIVGAIFSFKTRWRGFVGGIIILGYIGAITVYGWLALITLCLPR